MARSQKTSSLKVYLVNLNWYELTYALGYIKVFGVESRQKAEQEAAKIIKEVDVNDSGQIDFTGSCTKCPDS